MICVGKHRAGFTLIELLMVIAIIGTLSAIVLASLNNSKVRAEESVFISKAKTLQKSIQIYEIDHDTVPPSLGSGSNSFSNSCDGTLQASLQPLINEGILNSIPPDVGICISYGTNINLSVAAMCGGGNVTLQYLFLIYVPNTTLNLPIWYVPHYYCLMGPQI